MSSRAVNLAILLLLLVELFSGFAGFLTGGPGGRWVFWLHSLGGLTLVVLLAWKWRIVVRSVVRRGAGLWALPPAFLALLFLGSLATGLLWSTVGLPRIPVPVFGRWTGLTLHVALSLALVPLFVAHTIMRWPRPRIADFTGRRALLRTGGLLAAGMVSWQALEAASSLAGSDRRFTGSREEGSFTGNDHPRTNWLSDRTRQIDIESWRLRVQGRVERQFELTYAELLEIGGGPLRETLDCTGGWYTVQDWTGIPLSLLLERAGEQEGARSVVVRSVTGFERRFSLGKAPELLLATHVGGEGLSPGHGFPVRLVAPGHRGYNWVKWVEAIEVSDSHPLLQPPLPLQ
jgi:DMSO/TMAO reductase YedYZ molybdopterin-dependent catalytic subunit